MGGFCEENTNEKQKAREENASMFKLQSACEGIDQLESNGLQRIAENSGRVKVSSKLAEEILALELFEIKCSALLMLTLQPSVKRVRMWTPVPLALEPMAEVLVRLQLVLFNKFEAARGWIPSVVSKPLRGRVFTQIPF
eukprot:s1249_g12.t1